MKIIHVLAAASAAFFYVGTASAQQAGTTTKGSIAIGKGVGNSGFSPLILGSGQIAVGQAGTEVSPSAVTPSGDVTISAAGVTAIGSLKILTGMIANNAVTLAKLATISNNRALCNVTGGASVPVECTAAQLTTLVNTFTSSLSGAVPAPITPTNKFLRDDGTWQSVAGAGTVTSVDTAGLATGGPFTSAGTVTVTAASKAQQQTGTSAVVAVTPSQQQQHDSAAKVVAMWNGTSAACPAGACTVSFGYNVASISRASAGSYTVTFNGGAPFASTAYACVSTAGQVLTTTTGTKAVGSVSLTAFAGSTGTATDSNDMNITCYGRQ